MIISALLGFWLSIAHPKPLLIEVAIDSSRLIGLPRLRTMDAYITKIIELDEMHTAPLFKNSTRKEFFIGYFKFST